ncbi:MAG: hypothetical protein AAB388_00830 [Patescibacteria group bacterium]
MKQYVYSDMAEQPPQELKQAVLERIEEERVCPKSRWFFWCQDSFIWFLWAVAVFIGAVAIAVTLFVVTHRQYALYEATHENFTTFFVEFLPYLWFAVLAGMVLMGVYNLRQTKRGYRHPLWLLVSSSVMFSFAGGALLQAFGFGYLIDHTLGQQLAIYMSQEKLEQKLWQVPAEGRLIGRRVLEETDAPATTIVFEDISGNRWVTNVTELLPRDLELLRSQKTVRLIGTITDEGNKNFHTCGAFPWLLDDNFSSRELSAERRAFLERAYEHMHRADERLLMLEKEAFAGVATTTAVPVGICANLAIMRKLGIRCEQVACHSF